MTSADRAAHARFLSLAVRARRTSDERDELDILARGLGLAACRDLAVRASVGGLVIDALWTDVPAFRDELDGDRRANAARVRGLIEALADVTGRFDADIRWCAVEGASVLLGTSMPEAAYSSGDLDVLLSPGSAERARRVFAACGFVPADRRNRPTCRVEYGRRTASGQQWLEAGEEIFDRMWVPLSFSSRPEAWLAGRVPAARHPGLFTVNPTDALTIATLHASMHAFVRSPGLRLYAEIDRLVADAVVDWDSLVDQLAMMRAATRGWVALTLASRLLATPTPAHVMDRLQRASPRGGAALALVEREDVLFGKRRLGMAQTVLLDRLLDERSLVRWVTATAVPSRRWLAQHFGGAHPEVSTWRLHVRRCGGLLMRWRPE